MIILPLQTYVNQKFSSYINKFYLFKEKQLIC